MEMRFITMIGASRLLLKGIVLVALVFLIVTLTFYDIGISQDDAAILLASIELRHYSFIAPLLQDNLLFRLFNYSHGWMNLAWTHGVYATLDMLGFSLRTWALIFPSTLLIWITGGIVFHWTYLLTRKRIVAMLATILFLTTPIVLGLARSYTIQVSLSMAVRTILYYCIYRSFQTGRRWRAIAVLVAGVVVISENAFPITLFVGLIMIYLHWYSAQRDGSWSLRLWGSFQKTIRYILHPFISIPIGMMVGYGIAYWIESLHPFGLGFFRYTLKHKSGFGLPNDYFTLYFDHWGYGMGLVALIVVPTILWVTRFSPREHRGVLQSLILWTGASTFLVLLYPPDNSMLFSSLVIPALCILSAYCFTVFVSTKRVVVVGLATIALLGNGISSMSFAFGVPWQPPQLYGVSYAYYWSRPFKAVGAFLRSTGVSPQQYRDKERPIPDERFILAGNPPGEVPYPAALYWGATVGIHPNAETNWIVVLKNWQPNRNAWNEAIQFVKTQPFGVVSVIVHNGELVGRVYKRNFIGPPQVFEQRFLETMWDNQFSSFSSIEVPGRYGPHAL